jgi:hypothetical protein
MKQIMIKLFNLTSESSRMNQMFKYLIRNVWSVQLILLFFGFILITSYKIGMALIGNTFYIIFMLKLLKDDQMKLFNNTLLIFWLGNFILFQSMTASYCKLLPWENGLTWLLNAFSLYYYYHLIKINNNNKTFYNFKNNKISL